jgi:hypothetical protein
MSKYYPKGIQKVAYVRWSQIYPLVRFTEHTFGGPPSYVCTTDNSVRSLLPKDQCLASIFLRFQSVIRLALRVLDPVKNPH